MDTLSAGMEVERRNRLSAKASSDFIMTIDRRPLLMQVNITSIDTKASTEVNYKPHPDFMVWPFTLPACCHASCFLFLFGWGERDAFGASLRRAEGILNKA
ncbi:hypothetical protein TEQG_03593 [Trichophyton equinum CBS 127.97]|uniref:Uncharacterized protein n=1 Tax=Trichophyton equinum (strain ATCC MYA-4606 / CBS 127.97) TaxID=559882 RepID=F2PR74_TRIEC|nr:hypothetical protein TEQG_03593 [Trichophyton equinum CBS 127.97]